MHIKSLPSIFLALALAACGADPGSDATDGVCDVNPEPGVRPQRLSSNGQHLNTGYFNTGYLNTGYMNTGYINTGYVNTGYANTGYTNGAQVNGIQANGLIMQGISLNANELVGTTTGKVVNGEDLVGAKLAAVLADGRSIELTISSFERRPAGDPTQYRVDYDGQNICGDGVKGIFLAGVWDERASHHDAMTVGGHSISTTFACADGMLAKCVGWGYAPWKVGAELHQTCTRMGRADYCGAGTSFTKNGTLIDVYDTRAIQTRTSGDPSLVFEAGWGPNGAVCVNRARFDAYTTSGESVLPSCWASLPKCGSFEEAQTYGATIGNSSRIQSRTLCSAR